MKYALAVLGLVVVGALFWFSSGQKEKAGAPQAVSLAPMSVVIAEKIIPPETMTMKLSSSAFENNGMIPALYTCDGAGTNPPLVFSGVPQRARSLVFIMEDPDVPASVRPDGMWDHWVVYNMPASITEIKTGVVPPGVVGVGSSGKTKYTGPCPPDREHRYFFKLFALDVMLDLPQGATKAQVLTALRSHIVATAELVGRYDRVR